MPKKLANNMSNLLALDSPISLEDIHSLEPSTYRSLSNFNNTQIAVTGANGFLASNIIFYLLTLSTKLSLNLQINALCRSRSRLTSRFSSTQSISNSSGNSPLLFTKYTPTTLMIFPCLRLLFMLLVTHLPLVTLRTPHLHA